MFYLEPIKVAIVDYGLGNIFSVRHACEHAGMLPDITSSPEEILSADVVILPGMGAFGDAMQALRQLDLVSPLRDVAESGNILVGVCLGLQLLMSESYEFGRHRGLGIIEGPVVRFEGVLERRGDSLRAVKVPQVGWNQIWRPEHRRPVGTNSWSSFPLVDTADGEFMYFVHSYHVKPEDRSVIASTSNYGGIEFCSSVQVGNVFACQFHPERSGEPGLRMYQNIAAHVHAHRQLKEPVNA